MSGTSTAKDQVPAVDAGRRALQLQEYALVFVVIALMVIGTLLRPGSFLTSGNLLTIVTSASVVGVLAIGMTFVIATGGIDLSVGSIVAAAAIAGGLVSRADWLPDTLGSAGFIVTALLFGLLLGTVNALAVTWDASSPSSPPSRC
jgi:ribose transport system permease protein